jgi:hypothetical protein
LHSLLPGLTYGRILPADTDDAVHLHSSPVRLLPDNRLRHLPWEDRPHSGKVLANSMAEGVRELDEDASRDLVRLRARD